MTEANTNNSRSDERNTDQAKSKRTLIGLINKINKASKKLEVMVHEAAMGCLQHAVTFSDAEPARLLFMAMPKSQRREALVDWFHEHSPIRIRQEGEKVGILKETAKDYTPFNLEAAEATPYWEKSERGMMKPMGHIDPEKIIQQQIDRITKRMEEEAEAKKAGNASNVVFFKEGVDPNEELSNLKAALAAIQNAKPAKKRAA